MGFIVTRENVNLLLQQWRKKYDIYGPITYADGGRYADAACVRYGLVANVEDIAWQSKSLYSAKEVVYPIVQLLSYQIGKTHVALPELQKDILVLLHSCDCHAMARLDAALQDDAQYQAVRRRCKWVLLPCRTASDTCFCVAAGTNHYGDYALYLDASGPTCYLDCRDDALAADIAPVAAQTETVVPQLVEAGTEQLTMPIIREPAQDSDEFWQAYEGRCTHCGRCTFVCPVDSAFSIQRLPVDPAKNVLVQRRLWASSMRGRTNETKPLPTDGTRMQFRFTQALRPFANQTMCVGCGRCDDVCPEYISFIDGLRHIQAGKEVD